MAEHFTWTKRVRKRAKSNYYYLKKGVITYVNCFNLFGKNKIGNLCKARTKPYIH